MSDTFYYGTGRRKTSTARVFLKSGKGDITVNKKPLDVFFASQLPGQDHLQRDDAVQAYLPRFVHDTHPPLAEFLEDLVVGDRLTEHRPLQITES